MNIADIISATMLATSKHDDSLPMKNVHSVDITNDKITFIFVDANTDDYTINKDGNEVDFPSDRYKRCDNCHKFLYEFFNYCPACGAKQIS